MGEAPVAVVLGTRPEAIKLFLLVEELGSAVRLIHTGQHFDDALSSRVAGGLGMRAPDLQLRVGGLPRGVQIGRATAELTGLFHRERPGAVIVQGDTNAALAGALAANAEGIPLLHVEAGLRSFDRAMPEEHNRVLIDHLADLCAAPTETARDHLVREGVDPARIEVTGNTIVEAVQRMVPTSDERRSLLDGLGLVAGGFVVATLHRPENTDHPATLATVLHELAELPLPVVLPIHPRAEARIHALGLTTLLAPLRVIPPVEHRTMLGLLRDAALVVSDSGGIQEEVTVLKRFVLVVRRSTERPEALGSFAALTSPEGLAEKARRRLREAGASSLEALPCPFGDGLASRRIARATRRLARAADDPVAGGLVDALG